MLQYFETILPSVESLSSFQKDEVNFMGVLLKVCDVTKNGRHLGFYQELEIRLKPRYVLDM